jgi:hypothetical protein
VTQGGSKIDCSKFYYFMKNLKTLLLVLLYAGSVMTKAKKPNGQKLKSPM